MQDKEISLTPEIIKDEAIKKQLIGLKAGDVLNLNIFSLFNENHTVIGSSLGISKEAVADLNPVFSMKVTEVKRRFPAELNQELFDKIMGEGVVSDLDAFKAKIRENLEAYYKNESRSNI
jgi:trigger factor